MRARGNCLDRLMDRLMECHANSDVAMLHFFPFSCVVRGSSGFVGHQLAAGYIDRWLAGLAGQACCGPANISVLTETKRT